MKSCAGRLQKVQVEGFSKWNYVGNPTEHTRQTEKRQTELEERHF